MGIDSPKSYNKIIIALLYKNESLRLREARICSSRTVYDGQSQDLNSSRLIGCVCPLLLTM